MRNFVMLAVAAGLVLPTAANAQRGPENRRGPQAEAREPRAGNQGSMGDRIAAQVANADQQRREEQRDRRPERRDDRRADRREDRRDDRRDTREDRRDDRQDRRQDAREDRREYRQDVRRDYRQDARRDAAAISAASIATGAPIARQSAMPSGAGSIMRRAATTIARSGSVGCSPRASSGASATGSIPMITTCRSRVATISAGSATATMSC